MKILTTAAIATLILTASAASAETPKMPNGAANPTETPKPKSDVAPKESLLDRSDRARAIRANDDATPVDGDDSIVASEDEDDDLRGKGDTDATADPAPPGSGTGASTFPGGSAELK